MTEFPAAGGSNDDSRASLLIVHRAALGAALTLLPIALWCVTHRYRGLIGDSELYAMQALARLDPSLGRDVFLSAASQDRYTLFSPVYSLFIRILGLPTAALSLLVLLKVCFYVAAWGVVRKLSDSATAFLSVALLVAAPTEYGAYHVFSVSEDMLTARTAAEALAMMALCLYLRGRGGAALAVAGLGLSFHALMALPMVLLLLSLHVGVRASAGFALAMVAAVLGAAAISVWAPERVPDFLAVMDPSWLDVVRERSQFVFLKFWRLQDWATNARPILSLSISVLVLHETQARTVGTAALLVGAAGLAIGFIAGTLGPVAIFLQGQAWRWIWVPETIGLLLLAPTLLRMWRDGARGIVCGALLLGGWTSSACEGCCWIAVALGLWAWRGHVSARAIPYMKVIAVGIGLFILSRLLHNGWAVLWQPPGAGAAGYKGAPLARAVLGAEGLPLALALLAGFGILQSRSLAVRVSIALALGTVTALAAPSGLKDPRAEGFDAQVAEFADWRQAIPPGENVFVVPHYYSAGFTWFTLQRPSYLTVDQSSGVIFSRATATEIRRRSQILVPMEQPDWRLLSNRAAHGGKFDPRIPALTRERLLLICKDPALNFVVAKEDVGFEPLRHRSPGAWDGWNLYDCSRVDSLASSQ
jgi:hypothetical protein